MGGFCYGGTLPLKVDEAKVEDNTTGMDKYPFRVPQVVLEGYHETCIPQTICSWNGDVVNLIRKDEVIEYTQLDYFESLIKDKDGNVIWADVCPVSPDVRMDGEDLGKYRNAKKYLITEYNLDAMETRRFKVVLDKKEAFTEWDFMRLEMILNGSIIDTHYVVNKGVLERLIGKVDDLAIPDSVIKIDEYFLQNYERFENVSIPRDLVDIPDTFFRYCHSSCVTVDANNPRYYIENGCLIDRYTSTLVWGYGERVIPSDGSVNRVGVNAFSHFVRNERIVIPDAITEIEPGAFSGCYCTKEVSVPDVFADRVEDIFGKKFVKEGDIWKVVREERKDSGFYF